MWTLDEALDVCRRFNEGSLHWNVALTGGVLNRGHSDKDLDLVFYPLGPVEDLDKLYESFVCMSWYRTHTATTMVKHWRSKGSNDNKHVEVWRTRDGKRVDVIISSRKVAGY